MYPCDGDYLITNPPLVEYQHCGLPHFHFLTVEYTNNSFLLLILNLRTDFRGPLPMLIMEQQRCQILSRWYVWFEMRVLMYLKISRVYPTLKIFLLLNNTKAPYFNILFFLICMILMQTLFSTVPIPHAMKTLDISERSNCRSFIE